MTRPIAVAVVIVALAVSSFLTSSVGAGRGTEEESGQGGVDRVLLVTLPALGWEDLAGADLPVIDALLADAAVAALTPLSADLHTDRGDGYATLGAGARARGVREAALAFEAGEPFGSQAAGELYTQRTGSIPSEGNVVNLGAVGLDRANEALSFGTEVGALANALAAVGRQTAVVGNADRPGRDGEAVFDRYMAVGAADAEGITGGGVVSGSLNQTDADMAYGLAASPDAVSEAFRSVWPDGGLVLVEASDLARWDSFRSQASEAQERALRLSALEGFDTLLGEVLAEVDPERDAVIVVGPYHRSADPHLTVAALRAPGVDPGLLRSATTRRAGFVVLADVAPTVLDLLDIAVPDSMEGRPFSAVEDSSGEQRFEVLANADAAAAFRDDLIPAATTVLVVIQILLWPLAAAVLRWGSSRHRRVLEVLALSLVGFLTAGYLVGAFALHDWAPASWWFATFGLGLVLAGAAVAVGRAAPVDPLIIVLGALATVLAVDVVLGAPLQLNTVFGYSPRTGGRYAGYGNLAFAQLAAAALLLSGLVSHRIGGRRGVAAGGLILCVAIVLDGAPFWGSDVGGVLALVPGAGVAIWLMAGRELRLRTAVLLLGAAAVAVVSFGIVDLNRPANNRTHLGRLFEAIGNDGLQPFQDVVTRKLGANLGVLTSSPWALSIPLVLGLAAYLFWKAPGALESIQERVPSHRAAMVGLIVAMVLGFALNDSGIAIPAVMMGVVNSSVVFLLLRTAPPVRFLPEEDHDRHDRTARDEREDPVRTG